ncbi:hypothetical protein GW17_00015098 [Ensete ventricosum]|nr:hypothetical protein GW17_00015098 [Ensete ventricosum]RZR89873.1 hypothetical protein BHM03_00017685 [Ensete ventricosum]
MLIPVNYLLMERKGVIRVIIHKEATSDDILQSFFHALILANLTGKAKSLHTESRLWMEEHYHDFIAKVQHNSNINGSVLDIDEMKCCVFYLVRSFGELFGL